VTPVRGQIVCTETLPKTLDACISTTDCYLAQKQHGEIIIGSTTEHAGYDTRVTAEAGRTLAALAAGAPPPYPIEPFHRSRFTRASVTSTAAR
jgi:hydrogen cyanide synthase HcnC